MTAPVLQEPGPRKLAMTAPALQPGPVAGFGGPAEYSVAFVLPTGVTAETALLPSDPRVRGRAVPGSLAAVLGFSGSGSASAFQKRNNGLHSALILAGLTPVGPRRFFGRRLYGLCASRTFGGIWPCITQRLPSGSLK